MQINKKFIKSLLNYDMSDLIDGINESFYTHSKILYDEQFDTEQELFSFVKFLAYLINFSKKFPFLIGKVLTIDVTDAHKAPQPVSIPYR